MPDRGSVETDGNDSATKKRAHSDESHTPPRQRREKYTSVACNECKRRKIKCSGGTVCRHCQSYDTPCVYAQNGLESGSMMATKRFAKIDSDMRAFQQQIGQLAASISQIQAQNGQSPSKSTPHQPLQELGRNSTSLRSPRPTEPHFIGTTSSAFSFKVANSTLESMGLQHNALDDPHPIDSLAPSRQESPEPEPSRRDERQSIDPLISITMAEVYRLLEAYKEELLPIYPFIPIDEIVEQAPRLYSYVQLTSGAVSTDSNAQMAPAIDSKDVEVLKIILASALILEGSDQSKFAQQLIDSVETAVSRSAREVQIDLRELQILTLTSSYHFHCNDEVLAWRTIGFASRIALEMGLHRKDSLYKNFPDAQRRSWATRLFWCIYVLDRRWSFGTGMPFALQDSDIDPQLPQPDGSVPYLQCMVDYGRICSRVWRAVTGFENPSKPVDKDTVAYLDFQIQRWLQSIPSELQLLHPRLGIAAQNQPRTLQMLRVLLYVRGNQMRTLIHRQNVLSATSIVENPTGAHVITDIAKDTIRVLVHLKETSNIYDTQPNAFNYFLVSALAALFLAVCHAPAEFSHTCRDEFYSALDLVKGFSSRSFNSRRLWNSVRSLKHIAPRLGLTPDKQPLPAIEDTRRPQITHIESSIPASTGTVTASDIYHLPQDVSLMPLENHHNSSLWLPNSASDFDPSGSSISIPDMFQISDDLTDMFEAFGHVDDRPGHAGYNLRDGPFSLHNSAEVSRLFEALL